MVAGAGNKRKLRVTAQPNVTMTPQHVPWHCRRARTLLLGPLTPQDLHSAAFVSMPQGTAPGLFLTHHFLSGPRSRASTRFCLKSPTFHKQLSCAWTYVCVLDFTSLLS